MNKNVILYFTDLEGTMLREKDGQYDREELYKLFGQLSDLQNSLQADVKINIVSPIFMEQMKKLVSHFNLEIARYNRSNPSSRLDEINAAMASLDSNQYFDPNYTYDVIEPFPRIAEDGGERGKMQHVSNWMDIFPNAKLYIYAGNGRNDILAMRKVLSSPRGAVICPTNSRTQVKEIATFVSDKEEMEGIIEGLSRLNERVRTRQTGKDVDDDGDR